MTVARRVTRLEHVARLRGGPPVGLCDDDRLALLNEAGLIAYHAGRVIVVSPDAPGEVARWVREHAPAGYSVA